MIGSLRFPGLIGRSTYFFLAAAAMVLAQSSNSFAETVAFNPNGTGSAGSSVGVATFSELPGNALAVGGQTAINNALASLTAPNSTATSAVFTVYYQANVQLVNSTGQVISTSQQFTAVAAFNEVATVNNSSTFGNTVTFSLAADQSHLYANGAPIAGSGGSYLDFFAQPAGNTISNSAGTGFASDNNATLIYSASLPSNAASGNFTNTVASTGIESLNGTGTGSTTQQSITGFGGTSLSVGSNYYNSNYFTAGVGTNLAFSSTNALTFQEVSPASQFIQLNQTGSTLNGYSYIAPSLGAVNGIDGSDFQFQAHASASFNGAVVPEPASLAMTSLGLSVVGLGTFFSRRRAKARKTVA